MCSCTLAVVAGPLNSSTKNCSSSISLVGAGLQVLHEGPTTIELIALSARQQGASARFEPWHHARRAAHARRWSALKSNTHSRSLVQRPWPWLACASSQLRVSGAGALGSPKFTAAPSNLATAPAHARHFALGREMGDGERLCSAGREPKAGGKNQGEEIAFTPGLRVKG